MISMAINTINFNYDKEMLIDENSKEGSDIHEISNQNPSNIMREKYLISKRILQKYKKYSKIFYLSFVDLSLKN